MINVPSPAIAVVGRHNSGKTTIIEKLIGALVARGHDVGSIKHHSHLGIEVDYPGKDSYRHRAAGASETVIASPDLLARIRTLHEEVECKDIVRSMPGHDIVVVEGYRKSGLPTIEIMRAANTADVNVARAFIEGARAGWSLGTDFIQQARSMAADGAVADVVAQAAAGDAATAKEGSTVADLARKMPTAETVAVVTDIPEAQEAAAIFNIPAFAFDDIEGICDFLEERYVRPRVSVVIQAGGESRRMGQSKATVPFAGRPLICRLIERLAPVADELIITTNEAERLGFLDEMYPDLDIKLVSDAFDFRGALPGLYTALTAARNPYVAVVACDMVFASGRLVVAESLCMAETGADVVVPVNQHGFEPFHGLYRRETCLAAVRRALDAHEKRAQAFFNDPSIEVFEFSQERVLDAEPRGGCFINANTPEELKRIEDTYLGE